MPYIDLAKSDHTHDNRYYTESEVNNLLNSKVPTTRTINGKALSANITLAAADVNAAELSHSHYHYWLPGDSDPDTIGLTGVYTCGKWGGNNLPPLKSDTQAVLIVIWYNGDITTNIWSRQIMFSPHDHRYFLRQITGGTTWGPWTLIDVDTYTPEISMWSYVDESLLSDMDKIDFHANLNKILKAIPDKCITTDYIGVSVGKRFTMSFNSQLTNERIHSSENGGPLSSTTMEPIMKIYKYGPTYPVTIKITTTSPLGEYTILATNDGTDYSIGPIRHTYSST